MKVTQELLELAMKKAVEVGLIPEYADEETYLRNWEGMRQVLTAVLEKIGDLTNSEEQS